MNRRRIAALLAGLCWVLGGCGGGGGSGSNNVPASGVALLGPLARATVEIFEYPNFAVPVHTTTTSAGSALADIGLFDIPANLLHDDKLYVLRVSGGADHDADDDGVADAAPTPNQGRVRALLTGAQIKARRFHVSALTEIAYQRLTYLLSARYPPAQIIAESDSAAAALLRADLNGDGHIDMADVAAWDPVRQRAMLRRDPAAVTSIAQKILSDTLDAGDALALTDPVVSELQADRFFTAIEVVGTRAWVAGFNLQAIDISPAGGLTSVGSTLTGDSGDVVINGNIAYTTQCGSGGQSCFLVVRDITNPAQASILHVINLATERGQMERAGSLLYVADAYNGLEIYSLDDPSNPTLVGRTLTSTGFDFPRDVTVSGSRAYVANFQGGFVVVDVADPAHPQVLGSLGGFSGANFLTVQGNTAYVTDDTDAPVRHFLHVIDVSNPAAPQRLAKIETQLSMRKPVVHQGLLYAGLGFDSYAREPGLHVFDVATPAAAMYLGLLPTRGYPFSVALAGDRLLVGDGDRVELTDAVRPAAPTALAQVPADSISARSVAVAGTHALIVEFGKLTSIDIANPLAPQVTGELVMPTFFDRLVVDGTRAIAGLEDGGIQMIDLSNPAQPASFGNGGKFDTPNTVVGVALVGNYAYVLDFGAGLYVLDVTNPAAVTQVNRIDLPGLSEAYAMAVAGNRAYVLNRPDNLVVYDLSSPTTPTVLGQTAAPSFCGTMSVTAQTVFIGCNTDGFRFVDVADPTAPLLTDSLLRNQNSNGIAVDGSQVYLFLQSGDTRLMSITAPGVVRTTGVLRLPIFPSGAVSNGYLFVGSADRLLTVYRASAAPAP